MLSSINNSKMPLQAHSLSDSAGRMWQCHAVYWHKGQAKQRLPLHSINESPSPGESACLISDIVCHILCKLRE